MASWPDSCHATAVRAAASPASSAASRLAYKVLLSAIPDHLSRSAGGGHSPPDWRAQAHCPEPLPPAAARPASGAGQCIAPGLFVQVGQPGLTQGLNGGVGNHRGLLGTVDLVAGRDVQPPVPVQAPSRTSAYDRAQVTCGERGGYGDNPGQPRQRGGDVVRGEASAAAGLGLIMVPRFGPAGVQPAHGNQAEPEVADFGQQPVQRGLVSDQAADDRVLALAADLQAVEPGEDTVI